MTIKEVEDQLELPRATIRFYEKEGLIHPKRGEKSYREYSEDDVADLKKIVVLRKIGLSVDDIEDFFEDAVPLQELLGKTITELEVKKNELEAAIRVCKKMQDKQESRESFDGESYWQEIREEERTGKRFMELVNDVVEYEEDTFLRELYIIDQKGRRVHGMVTLIMKLVPAVFAGVLSFFIKGMKWQAFMAGFIVMGILSPLVYMLVLAVLGLPIHLIGKRYPKLSSVIRKSRISYVIQIMIGAYLLSFFYKIFL